MALLLPACSGGSDPADSSSGGGSALGGSGVGGSAAGSVSTGGAGSAGASNIPAAGSSMSGGGAAGSGSGAAGVAGVAGVAGAAGVAGTSNSAGTGGGSGQGPGGPVGFASLNGGTVGGEGGEVVTASTYEQLKTYAESATAYVIMVQGTISNGANGGKISVKSNKSLIGVGSTAFLNGIGVEISSASNIILRNLRISLIGVTTRSETPGVYTAAGEAPRILVNDGDAISISGSSKNIWIDHCELFSESPSTQTNKDLYDGLIDIKGQTGFITISWCYLHDHHKGGLVGASDTDLFADRKVTFHHNHYQNVKLRVPLYRGAVGHFFNNYVVAATDASEIRAGTCVRVEKNYYEALHFSIYTPSDAPGSTERIDNVEASRTERAYPANCSADIPYPYSDVLSDVNDVDTLVPQSAGVGKL